MCLVEAQARFLMCFRLQACVPLLQSMMHFEKHSKIPFCQEWRSFWHSTQEMVDKDLPPALRNTWQINLEQLQLVLDAEERPVALGSGANGTVWIDPLPMHDIHD